MPIQQMLLGAGGGAVATKTYVDDIFSTFLYTGTNATLAINNGIDLATEGGMVVSKSRSNANAWNCWDTERGVRKFIKWEGTSAEQTSSANSGLTGFNTNGFTLGTNYNTENWDGGNGGTPYTYTSNSFRKAPGFFDVVTWTGNGSNRTISHSLGSIPGLILIKSRTFATGYWVVYHRDVEPTKALHLNDSGTGNTTSLFFNDTKPTSTNFSLGAGDWVNKNSETYVAYVFAGGESTAATARSVDFDGSGDYLSAGSSSDFTMGTGDFTIEGWVKHTDANNRGLFYISNTSGGLATNANGVIGMGNTGNSNSDKFQLFAKNSAVNYFTVPRVIGQWYHFAVVRASSVLKVYINGSEEFSTSDTTNYNGTYIAVGGYYSTSYLMKGNISNFRVVKGTAVYTSSFKPPTEPLTNITNTKLLCCNDSSTTGSTVTPGTITANGNPTASTDSPFDDPAGFVFGDAGDQNVIKCGSYVGNGDTTNGTKIQLGFEPQWLLIKSTGFSEEWHMFDCMRGIVNDGNDIRLEASTSGSELTVADFVDIDASGFTALHQPNVNKNNEGYVYMAIRRPDGYVGKPPSLGSDCFQMDTGSGSSTIPNFDSGFPVDFALTRQTANTSNWLTAARLQGTKYMMTDSTNAESNEPDWVFDSNVGWHKSSIWGSAFQSWMWKRHAGFDVVCDVGSQVAKDIPHSLNAVPEMMIRKNRTNANSWVVYHKDLPVSSGGDLGFMYLNASSAADTTSLFWNKAPTSTHFSVGTDIDINQNNKNIITMLFASVDGISKVGSYSGSSSAQTITTGFQPRFVIIKKRDSAGDWAVLDTVRGWGSNDKVLYLNGNWEQVNYPTSNDVGYPTSTGFVVDVNHGFANQSGQNYIYYAHA